MKKPSRVGSHKSLLAAYKRGRRCLDRESPVLSKADFAQSIADLAEELSIEIAALKKDMDLAKAVDLIVANCGNEAFHVLFAPQRPQTRKAIMQLSRTADTRQRHRISGVVEGKFRSVAPQRTDSVFDTVSFSEVPSRLARARGAMQELELRLKRERQENLIAECHQLARLCRSAANQLVKFLHAKRVAEKNIPRRLTKSVLWPRLMTKDEVRGKTVGYARLAVRLTIKSLWDYPEMRRRKMRPTKPEIGRVKNEVARIANVAKFIP